MKLGKLKMKNTKLKMKIKDLKDVWQKDFAPFAAKYFPVEYKHVMDTEMATANSLEEN